MEDDDSSSSFDPFPYLGRKASKVCNLGDVASIFCFCMQPSSFLTGFAS